MNPEALPPGVFQLSSAAGALGFATCFQGDEKDITNRLAHLLQIQHNSICSFTRNQLIVRPRFDNITTIKDDNATDIADGGEPVCNDQCCTSDHRLLQCLLYHSLRCGIQSRSSLIKYQNLQKQI